MESYSKSLPQSQSDNDPFEIIHNARKKCKNHKLSTSTKRRSSQMSPNGEKTKKIKKNHKKSFQENGLGQQNHQIVKQDEKKLSLQVLDFMEDSYMQVNSENQMDQKQVTLHKHQTVSHQKQAGYFDFQDNQGEKVILEGIGDQNSLHRQFDYDFFNPENNRK